MGRIALALTFLGAAASLPAFAQVPRPFPKVETAEPARPSPPPVEAPAPVAAAPADPNREPSEATLGVPIYAGAQFIASYDAGLGQRIYLFGSDAGFGTLVKFYQGALKTRGILVFDAPATHLFEVGRFREESMAFPPGVTIKDYTWNSSPGYMNPKRGGQPERFPSIIQIVPALPVPQR